MKVESDNKAKELELKNLNENKKNLEEQLKSIITRIQDLDKTMNEE
jgi:peptidoglycan hydrolase CwlO-like protein